MNHSLDLKKHSVHISRDTWSEDEEGRGCTQQVIKQSPLVHVALSMDLTYRIDTPEAELVKQLTDAVRAIVESQHTPIDKRFEESCSAALTVADKESRQMTPDPISSTVTAMTVK